ncbi:unnamed protein product [Allacma fusca]|uniref:Uncharacterized protein n=1 Tax=Allacma fusca TaxID=39272 RepID=A0A8J2K8L6_9HEXA|nr:unnamed protein product [Allacma fusca]
MLPLIFISIFILSFSDVLTEKHSRPLKSGEISINVQNEQDLAILLKNVSDINISGSPGFISAYGPDAFPVLCGQMGSSTGIYHPIAVASRLGAGKLLGTTHDGFLIPETPTATSDRNKFVLNSIHWTSQTPNPVVAVIRDEEDSFVSYLQNSSIPAIRIPVAELTGVAQLKKFDVVIVKEFFGPTYAPIFTEYVEMGGGLIICLTSWAYYYFMQVPGHFGTNFPANMISTKAGFAWHGDALADPTTPHKTYNASTALLENTKRHKILPKLEASLYQPKKIR